MPPFFTHVGLSLIAAVLFFVFSVGMDVDHFLMCNKKAIITAAINPKKGSQMLTELGQTNCRGFPHTWRFGIIIASLLFIILCACLPHTWRFGIIIASLLFIILCAWGFHMLLDYVFFPAIPGSKLPL